MPRTLGASGPAVSPLGLGLAALGRPGYITLGHGEDLGGDRSVEAMERQAHEVLDAAYRAGVRYFDAARSYGRAEAFLASWLKAHGLRPETSPPAPSGATPIPPAGGWTPSATR